MAEEIPKQIGPYQIVEQLGRGGMAVVYKAVQNSLNRTVAVKVLPERMNDPAWAERFHREAQAIAMLNHPNIVQIIDKDEDDGRLYFAMEYVPGTSLDQVMQRRRLSLSEALKVFKQVCRGLEYAHQNKIIHRDLNPRNVLVSDDLSTVKLADFGICRVEAISAEMGTLSTREMSFGTLHYLAPEQAANMLQSDHRSDIFSLGVLFYEMLTGKVPVGRFNLPSRLNGEVPPELDPIVLKCLASEPSERYQSVAQILNHVQKLEENLRLRLVDELRGFSRSTSQILRRSTQPFGQKKPWMLFAGGVAVALLAVALFLVFQNFNDPVRTEPAVAETAQPEPGAETPDSPPLSEDSPPPSQAEKAESSPPQVERTESPAAPPSSPASRPATRASRGPAANPANETSSEAEPDGLVQVRSRVQAGELEAALEDVNALLEEQSDGPAVAESLFLKAEILGQLDRSVDERVVYSQIIERFAGHPRQVEAQYRMAELLRTERKDGWQATALGLFREVGNGNSKFAADALLRQGEIEAMLKLTAQYDSSGRQVPATLITYRKLVNTYPQSSSAEYAYWSLASMYRDAEQFELAVETLTNLGSRFPRTNWDAWWFAGELYEEKLKDNVRALEAYAKVPESSRNYDRAQRKLSRLKP